MKAIDRILQYIDYKGINNSSFEKKNLLSNGYLHKQSQRNAGLGEGVFTKILANNPDISPEWLLTGKGSMLKQQQPFNSGEALADAERQELEALRKKCSQLQDKVIGLQDELLTCTRFRGPATKEFTGQLNKDQPKLKAKANKKDRVG